MRLLRVLGFTLLLCALCVRAEEEKVEVDSSEDDAEPERPEEKEKTDEITEEKDVLVLHSINFDRALRENKYLLVEFYAPWCGHCRTLEPIYAEVAGQLKKESSAVRLAKVDAIEERELAEEFNVNSFPTIKFLKEGNRQNATDFSGKRTVKGITKWLDRYTDPASVLDDVKSAEELLDLHDVIVVGFFQDLEGDKAKAFYDVTLTVVDVNFGITSNAELFKKYDVQSDSVVLFKKFDDKRADMPLSEESKLDKDELISFINSNRMELVIPFDDENAELIFSSKVHKHILLFINSTLESHNAVLEDFRAVASEFKDKVLFIKIDVTSEKVGHVLKYFSLSENDIPIVRLINTETVLKYAMDESTINKDTLRKFCQDVLDGSVKPNLKSQEIPEDWDKNPVKVLVGKNFNEVAFDETKNVFVEFLCSMIVDYNGQRDLETFSKFLNNGGVLPVEEDKHDDDDDDDDDEVEVSDDLTEESPKSTNESSKDEL